MGNLETRPDPKEYGINLEELDIDEAYVVYDSSLPFDTWIYSLTNECVECDPVVDGRVPPNGTFAEIISTEYSLKLFAGFNNKGDNYSLPCSHQEHFGEFGIYKCNISDTSGYLTCNCDAISDPVNIFWPILCAFGFYFGLVGLWLLSTWAYRNWQERMNRRNSLIFDKDLNLNIPQAFANQPVVNDPPAPSSNKRIKAIDTFRGICITVMLFVNYGGGEYWFFQHSPWNGLTVADVLFPWFMWLMGVCIPISIRSLVKRKSSKNKAFLKILKRSLWLFILGLAISNVNYIDVVHLRIMGVLQRFAFTYLIIATFHLIFLQPDTLRHAYPAACEDIVKIVLEWLLVLLIVIIHLLIVFLLQVPDCPTGYFGPGGRHHHGMYQNCTGGATGYVDKLILGYNHMYSNPTPKPIYDTVVPFDPEGILGILQACFSVFLGVQAGMILISYKEHKKRIVRWLFWGVITGVVAAVLCKCTADDGWIPVNKNLWSLSFVLATSCFGYFLLTILYIIIDVFTWWNGAPFFYPGMNSILLYVGHEITISIFPFQWSDSKHSTSMDTHWYQLILDLWVPTLWTILAMWMYSIHFFVAL